MKILVLLQQTTSVQTRLQDKYWHLLTPDMYVSYGWLEPLLNCLHRSPDTATVSPVIRHTIQPKPVESIGNRVYLSGLPIYQNIQPY